MLPDIKVLVVENDTMSPELLSAMPGSKGALCTAAVNGREALEVL